MKVSFPVSPRLFGGETVIQIPAFWVRVPYFSHSTKQIP